MTTVFFEGIFLGLLTSINCAFFCLPVLFGLSINSRSVNRALILFLAGRLVIYLLIGYMAGMLGDRILKTEFLKPFCYLIMAILLLKWGINGLRNTKKPKCNAEKNFIKAVNPFIIGIIMELSPCPPFFAAVARAISLQYWVNSIIFFFGFFIASSVFLLIPFVFKSKFNLPNIKITLSYVSIIFCFVFLFKSISQIVWMIS